MGQPKSGSSTVAPSSSGVAALNQVLPQVQQYLSPTTNPYNPVMLQTAEQNPTQVAAAGQYSNAYGAANTGLQTYGQASDLIQGAAQPLTQAEINQYFNPYVNQVVGATEQQFNLQNAQQQNQVVGNEAAQGALGGNRTAVAGALTAGQQATAEDPIIAGMLQAGYTQQEAMAAQQYQQVPLAAASALQGIGAGQEAAAGNLGNLALGQYGLGTQQQQYNTGAQAGTLGASTAQDIALLQEQMARYGYPIQLTNMAAGDLSGLATAYGSNTITTPPPPSLVSGLSGLGVLGIGAGALFSKRGGRIQGLQTGGVPAMPYGASPASGLGPIPYAGGGSYIPQVGATNIARLPAAPPMAQPQDDSSNMFMNALKLSEMGSKSGSGGAGLLTNTSLGDTIGDTMQDWTAGADAFPAGTPGASGGRVPRAYGGLALPSSNRINVPTRGGLGMPSSMVMRRDAGGSADMSDTSTAAGTDVPPLNPMMANITYGLYGEAAPYGAQGMAEGGTPKDDIAPNDTVLMPDDAPPPEAPVQVAQGPGPAGVATDAPEIISTGVSRRAPEDPRGKVPYIRETAKKYGIDPNVAVNVARSEGLGTFTSGIPGEKSFGAFQLNTQGGMGNEFYRDTGLDPSDPRNENATIDYALRKASTGGWGPFHGAKNRYGYSNFAGINGNDGTQALALSEDTSGRGLGTTSPDTGGIPGVKPIKAADISGKTKPDKTDIALSIMAAGLGMMGSRSPYAGVGIGQGGLQGIQTYEALHKQRVGEAEHQATLEQQAEIANQRGQYENANILHQNAQLAEMKRSRLADEATRQAVQAETSRYHGYEMTKPQVLGHFKDKYNVDHPIMGVPVNIDPKTGIPEKWIDPVTKEPVSLPGQNAAPVPAGATTVPSPTGASTNAAPEGTPSSPVQVASTGPVHIPEGMTVGGQKVTPDMVQAAPAAPNKYNDEAIADLDKDDQAMVKAMARYDMLPNQLSTRSPQHADLLRSRALQYDSTYQPAMAANVQRAKYDWQNGKHGDMARNFSTAIDHVDLLKGLIANLDNQKSKTWNTLANAFKEEFGVPAPTNYDAASRLVAGEIVKATVGSQNALGDRDEIGKNFNRNRAPEAQLGVLNTYEGLMLGQLNNLERQYKNATRANDFKETLLSDRAREVFYGHGQKGGAPGEPKEGDRKQFKQGWGVYRDGQWAPE